MFSPDYVLLYVEDPIASAAFYAGLLGQQPVDTAPTFSLFMLENGLKFGLWARSSVQPVALGAGGGGELCIHVADRAAVDRLHGQWAEQGVAIAQRPVALDFGYTFVALDRDGHRLRVFVREGD
ncbi:VOC family protein [Pseudoduganella danionis]|uniref:Drug:proton antiporter n=1 Tax=Pseudoduganella danionis TaxID=1890295 RepID=A0ABW9SP19_9BURK|nr:VOC family protein [Pseudoduganella danionis]MTW32144.1 drug:proton antiporter [Pseudoduganella danionis]